MSSANCGTVWTQNLSYDSYGNVTKNVPTGSAGTAFNPIYGSGNHITNFSETYDGMGNTTRDNLGNTYSYDAEGRAVTVNGNTQVIYDAFNRAIEWNSGSSHSQVVYDPQGGKLA